VGAAEFRLKRNAQSVDPSAFLRMADGACWSGVAQAVAVQFEADDRRLLSKTIDASHVELVEAPQAEAGRSVHLGGGDVHEGVAGAMYRSTMPPDACRRSTIGGHL
jgi:hypothetical protein